MNKHAITAIIILMTLSLLGIITFQLYWISQAMRLKEEEFDRQVNQVLEKVVEKLETQEAAAIISEEIETLNLPNQPGLPLAEKVTKPYLNQQQPASPVRIRLISKDRAPQATANLAPSSEKIVGRFKAQHPPVFRNLDSTILRKLVNIKTEVDTGSLHFGVNKFFLVVRQDSAHQKILYQDSIPPSSAFHRLLHHPAEYFPTGLVSDSVRTLRLVRFIRDSTFLRPTRAENINIDIQKAPSSIRQIQKKKVTAKTDQLTDVIQKMAVEYVRRSLPLEERLSQKNLDNLLTNELNQAGIKLPFQFAVLLPNANQKTPVHSVNYQLNNDQSQYRIRLFPNDIYSSPNYLSLHFLDRDGYLLHSFRYIMGFSALFILLILSTFVVTVYTILKQKKISDIKNDFINNMTHEFKTPLATISLAVDSIANPKIIANQDRIRHYAGIIRDENKRMNKQVEEVLQMALLDKQELKLNQEPVNMHMVINQAVQNMHLLLESKNGIVTTLLQAPCSWVTGDEAHLGNVMVNLLDNAIKYSAEAPHIKIKTIQTSNYLLIKVEDNGIGMNRDTQRRIFEKFYRVSTGNIHNVKGFGLGLAYVKAIVFAHKGTISVKSELGRGSRFEVKLPVSKNN